jgi:hypothetical protein
VRAKTVSGSLEVASRHLARAAILLEVEGNLLAFDEFAHAGTLDSGDVDERVRAAVIRLNEAEAFGGVEPFNGASGHDEPFRSEFERLWRKMPQIGVAIFERKVRSKRN